MINSNDHMQEFLKQNIIKEAQPKEARPVGPDGFAEGIITEKTDNVIPVEEPEQDMSAANEKAEQILSQARAQADVLIDDARQEAETICEKAKKQGYLEGSNVQIADEMVNLIVAQRAYEMNSKVITTSDEMLQQANQLKR